MSRTYIVTGSAAGIGLATSDMLRSAGNTVFGIDLHNAEIEADLSTPEGRADAAAKAQELSGGRIDGVIACAGIAAPIPKTVSINHFGVTELLTALLPALGQSDAPRVAVVSSMASLHVVSPELVDAALSGDEAEALRIAGEIAEGGPEVSHKIYASSKRALCRWVRRESITDAWAGAGIPLNAVGPGTVTTAMTEELRSSPEGLATVDGAVPMPLNYHQPAESIANLLIWLTSVENTHMAGQTIYCDGGADAVLRGDDVWSWND